MIQTRFTRMFELEHPLMSAPMALHCGGTLAAAVSTAGGLGSFGGIHAEGAAWVHAQCAVARERTDRPFAIGFITPFLQGASDGFAAALEERPAAIMLSFSDPGEWGRRVKDVGCRLICQVQTFADADLALAAGADVLVAQGNEAGGHTGTMGLLPLLCGITEQYADVPVLAAGGIGSGRVLAAVLAAGADGALVGTAFLATPEAVEIDDDYKEAIAASDGSDTVFSSAYDIVSGRPWPEGIAVRTQRDAFTDEWVGREAELRARAGEVAPANRPRLFSSAAHFVSDVRPAADVVHQISSDAERVLRDRLTTFDAPPS